MTLNGQVVAAIGAVVAVTVLCSVAVALVVLDRRAEQLDRENAQALERVSDAVARRLGVERPGSDEFLLPGVLRPGRAAREGGERAVLAIVGGGLAGGAVALGLGLLLARRLRRPLDALADGNRAVAAGRFAHRVPETGPPELRSLAQAFNAMAAAIEHSEGERRAWLDDLAHELRTPVAVVQAYSEALVDGLVPDAAGRREAERAVAANAAQCAALLDALRGGLVGRDEDAAPAEVDAIAAAAAGRLESPAREQGVALRLAASAGTARVPTGSVALARVLDNLLANAVRATPTGGSVEIATARVGNEVWITVDDSGPGIAPEDRVRAFERFWRGDVARRRDGGQGLGLAITRRIVEHAGGSVVIADAPAGGARLHVRLPLTDGDEFAGISCEADVASAART